jgi:hypothetical protein
LYDTLYEGQTLIRNRATGEVESSTSLSEKTQGILEGIEKEYKNHHEPIHNETNEEEMEADVKNQLEQLGYL